MCYVKMDPPWVVADPIPGTTFFFPYTPSDPIPNVMVDRWIEDMNRERAKRRVEKCVPATRPEEV